MALAPRTATLFLIDCSASMGREHDIRAGQPHNEVTTRRSGLDVAKEYVKAKIVQRIMRDLKTTPFGVILFAHAKTKNILTTRAKEVAAEQETKFERSQDPYRHCYELLPLTKTIDPSLVDRVDDAVAGAGPETDAFSAVILGLETLDADTTLRSYPVKEICLLTDGESEINWDEDGFQGTARQMNKLSVGLTVIGIDFDDEELGFIEKDKTEVKRENEAQFRAFVDLLDQPSLVVNARQALVAIAAPQVKAVNSRADHLTLSLGNPETHPDSSLVMHVDVKKAVVPAGAPTMKQMSMRGFERVRAAQRAFGKPSQDIFSQASASGTFRGELRGTKRSAQAVDETQKGREGAANEDDDQEEEQKEEIRRKARFEEQQHRELQAQMAAGQGVDLGKIGVTLDRQLQNEGLAVADEEDADLAGHGVTKERHFFYRPQPKPGSAPDAAGAKGQSATAKVAVSRRERDGGIVEEDVLDSDEEENLVQVNTEETELTDAYHYGGTLVPIGDLEDDAGSLSGLRSGMEILNFMKQSDLHWDWRMGDVFYVYATHGEVGSEKTFSALVNGMARRESLAIVRFVKKGFNRDGKARVPDPQLGILFPHIEDGVEFCYWVRIPYAEDVRALTFPSLTRLFNRKGQPLSEHRLLPTQDMDESMEAFVDAMDLTKGGPPDKDGNPTDFFSVEDSFSPAIHNIQNTLVFRLSNPDADLPPAAPALTKYMDPPIAVAVASTPAAEKVKRVFDVQIVPPKPKKITRKTANYAQPGLEEEIQLDRIFGSNDVAEKIEAQATTPAAQLPPFDRPAQVQGDDSSDDDVMIIERPDDAHDASSTTFSRSGISAQGSEQGEEGEEEPDTDQEPDTEGEAEGEDADKERSEPRTESIEEIEQGVAQAMGLVQQSFSHSHYGLASDALRSARELAQKSHTQSTYNEALRTLVDTLRANPKKRDYLPRIKSGGLGLLVDEDTLPQEVEDFLEELGS